MGKTADTSLPGLHFLELTYRIDGRGRRVLAEIAKGREPSLHLLRPNYEEYVKSFLNPVDWQSYQRRFVELTGVLSEDPNERARQAWKVLFEPSKEQLSAVTELRGRRRRWFRRKTDG
jgi:hypothetical protein